MIQGSCSNHPEYHVNRSLESSLLVSVFLPQYSQVGEYNLALKIIEVLILNQGAINLGNINL